MGLLSLVQLSSAVLLPGSLSSSIAHLLQLRSSDEFIKQEAPKPDMGRKQVYKEHAPPDSLEAGR